VAGTLTKAAAGETIVSATAAAGIKRAAAIIPSVFIFPPMASFDRLPRTVWQLRRLAGVFRPS
jgi:hypothetical protein